MGWLWPSSPVSSSPESSSPSQSPPTIIPPHSASAPSDSTTSSPSQPAPSTPRAPTRDELAESELQSFLAELNATKEPWTEPTPAQLGQSTNTSKTNTSKSSPSRTSVPEPTSNIAPTALYPTRMSCRSAFDAAYYCQLPGGQFVNVYRHGTLRNCGELWENFWFCMRTNRGYMSEEEREGRVREHYWKRDAKYRSVREGGEGGGSSESVWEMRTERVEEGVFGGDWGEMEKGGTESEGGT